MRCESGLWARMRDDRGMSRMRNDSSTPRSDNNRLHIECDQRHWRCAGSTVENVCEPSLELDREFDTKMRAFPCGKAYEEEDMMGKIAERCDQRTMSKVPTAYPWCCRPRTRNRRVPATVGGYLTQTIWQSRRPSPWELECDARGLLAVSPVLGSVPTSEKQTPNRPREPGKREPGSGDRAHRTDNNQKQKQGRRTSNTREHPRRQEVSSQFTFILTILPLGAVVPFGLPALIRRGA